MKETSKSISRRLRDPNFISRYFRGTGIDIGAGTDPVSLYHELFPLMGKVRIWDVQDGDAQVMEGVEDNTYDFVHSSHCIEHLHNPVIGLENCGNRGTPYLITNVSKVSPDFRFYS